MTDTSFATKNRTSSVEETTGGGTQIGRVFVSRLSAQGFTSGREASRGRAGCYFEEYEIGIGGWKATIVKTLGYGTGRTRLRAKYDTDSQYRGQARQRANSLRRRKRRRGCIASS